MLSITRAINTLFNGYFYKRKFNKLGDDINNPNGQLAQILKQCVIKTKNYFADNIRR